MKRPRYELGTVFVELTRRCNMKCGHCMRGNAQAKDMSDEVMESLLYKLRSGHVCSVCTGGGESTLVPERMDTFFRGLASNWIYPSYIQIPTNGKKSGPAVIETLEYVNTKVAEVYVTMSNDDEHGYVDAGEWMSRIGASGVYAQRRNGIDDKRYDSENTLRMGRGADFGGLRGPVVESYRVDPDEEGIAMYESDFYVDVDGNVWPHCDLSYRFMRLRKDWCLGNVTDPDFDWYDAAVRFNLKHADELPAVLVEPGEEHHKLLSKPRSSQVEAAARDIASSRKIAKRLKISLT